MRLKDVGIGTRLVAGFGITLVIMLVIAATGIIGMGQMEKALSKIHHENRQKELVADQAFEHLNNITWTMRLFPYAGDASSQETLQKQMGEYRGGYRSAMATLEKRETSPQGQAIIARIKATLAEAVQKNNEVIELVRKGERDQALALQKNEADRLTLNIKAGFEELSRFEEKLSQEKYQEAVETYRRNRAIAVGLALAAIGFGVLLTVVLARGITGPLHEAVEFANQIARGDLTARCSYRGKDEPGRMIAAMNLMAEHLTDLVSRISNVSGNVSAASAQLQVTSESIASGTERVVSQIITVATASEEMAATSGEIAQNCQLAAGTSTTVSNAATSSAEVVQESIESMKRIAGQVKSTSTNIDSLGTRSNQIGEIVGTIEEIADQTNLLALNAAIEAARAGEQGRGFAVVADEVRALAERTTRATREIGEMIRAIQNETRTAVSAMEEGVTEVERGSTASEKSGQALEDILGQIQEISSQVSQIATAAEEQTATTSEISGNIQQVIEVMQNTARGAEETAAAAADLARQSESMQSLVRQFRLA